MDKILNEALRVAKLAGAKIKELRENHGYDEYLKNGNELVTTADLISDKLIKTELSKAFPEHKLISEAGATVGNYDRENSSSLPKCLDGYKVVVSSSGVFEDLKAILISFV